VIFIFKKIFLEAETFYVEIYDPNLQKVDFDCESKFEGNFYSFMPQKEGKVSLIFYLIKKIFPLKALD